MRISIREQLATLVILAVLIALAMVSIPTWIYVHNFVTHVETNGLALTASLKAARIDSELNLLRTIGQTIATRILLQQSFVNFYNDNATDPFAVARSDLESAMSTNLLTGLLQARLFSRNQTEGELGGVLNVTGSGVGAQAQNIVLPYLTPNGSRVNLSDTEYGYPPSLYPNVTYENLGYPDPYVPSTPAVGARAFPGVLLSDNGGLLLGPLMINESFALLSLTVPLRSLNVKNFILGYMTLVFSASSLVTDQSSREGLGSTGMVLVVGPENPSNRFTAPFRPANSTYSPSKDSLANSSVRFVLPPIAVEGQPQRHLNRVYERGNYSSAFKLSQYPGVLDVNARHNSQPNNAQAILSSINEQGVSVAIGVARPQSTLVDWAVVFEKAEGEAYEPINILRKILLGCFFGTAALILLVIFPSAHVMIRPIQRLKIATQNSVNPPGYEEYEPMNDDKVCPSSCGTPSSGSTKGFQKSITRRFQTKRKPMTQAEIDNHRRIFKIPGRVDEKKHIITDELTELTEVYNEMTDELVKQYTWLDEKVAKRTQELEISKKAAEAANESKTLFIANISHELKTPLNGIMGICAVCMEDNDILRIQHSLKTLYRSGELLLHLLEDLLSFSKNQISQQITLEEKEFRLGEMRSQILSIFDKQVQESNIAFTVNFVNFASDEMTNNSDENSTVIRLSALGPPGMGQLQDAYLWGDQHRILQVIINLVSNSLKFTPAGGRVQVRIRCVGEIEQSGDEGKSPGASFTGTGRSQFGEMARSGSTQSSVSKVATASVSVNKDRSLNHKTSTEKAPISAREKSRTPLPPTAKLYMFEFEVEDTGRGIPTDMQEKIFEPFVQVDSSLSKKFGGTGLGLSICSQLAKLMDGSIAVKSTVGVGSTFCLRISLKHVKDRAPSTAWCSTRSRARSTGSTNGGSHRNSLSSVMAQAPERSDDTSNARKDTQPRLVGLSTPFFAPNPIPPPTSKDEKKAAVQKVKTDKTKTTGKSELRVLVADDNLTNIEVVSRMLKLEKVHDVTVAKDGQEAYELVRANMDENQKFDLIFMDIQMPNLDGLQSTRLIRKMGYVAPIIALSAFSEESNVRECIESGMNEFLSKPLRRPALKNVLTKFATIIEGESEVAS